MTKKMIHSMGLMFLCMFAFVTVTFAWFSSQRELSEDRLWAMTLAKYFYDGDGTKDNPYIITNSKHLYNLSWLQNKNYFTDENGDAKTCYFSIGNENITVSEIDMAGELDGGTGTSGAIPPIGSKDNPFIGYFNGNGCVIKNLWVSTDPKDWKETPGEENYNIVDYSEGVGFFGYIERPEGDTTSQIYAGNFILENIEVTSHYSSAVIGLVAGYVDAAMSKIGVNNGIVTLKGSNTISSDHTLIGKISEDANWKDLPGMGGGGDLVIAPSGLKDTYNGKPITYDAFDGLSSGEQYISNSAKISNDRYSAYFRGILETKAPTPQPSKSAKYVYTGTPIEFGTGSLQTVRTTAGENTKAISSYASSDEEFAKLMQSYQSYLNSTNILKDKYYGIYMKNSPNITTNNISSSDKYPSNCIWFKPQNTGHCLIAFGVENKKDDSYVSIYRYKRDSSGKATNIQELQLVFTKSFGNGDIVAIDVYLSKESDLDYEYVIGKSTTGVNQPYFFFLKLAGVDKNAGDAAKGDKSILEKIEFVPDGFTASQFSSENYQPGETDLKITGTVNSVSIKFDEKSDGYVHYTKPTGTTITENITNGKSLNDNTGPYDPREETSE